MRTINKIATTVFAVFQKLLSIGKTKKKESIMPFKKGDLVIATKGLPAPNGTLDYSHTRYPLQVKMAAEDCIILYDPIWQCNMARNPEELKKRGFIIATPEIIEITKMEPTH